MIYGQKRAVWELSEGRKRGEGVGRKKSLLSDDSRCWVREEGGKVVDRRSGIEDGGGEGSKVVECRVESGSRADRVWL